MGSYWCSWRWDSVNSLATSQIHIPGPATRFELPNATTILRVLLQQSISQNLPSRPKFRIRGMFLEDRQLALAYESSASSQVAFIDESFQTKSPSFYSMTATLITSDPLAMQQARKDVWDIAGTDYHATATAQGEGLDRIRKLLDYVRNASIGGNVLTISTDMNGRPKYIARAATLGHLITRLPSGSDAPHVLVMDAQDTNWKTRVAGLDLNDRAVVAEMIDRELISDSTLIVHSKGTHEPLLHLPDTVQWAAQRALRFGNLREWNKVQEISALYSTNSDLPLVMGKIAAVRKQAVARNISNADPLSTPPSQLLSELEERGPNLELLKLKLGTSTGLHIASEIDMEASLLRHKLALSAVPLGV